MPRNATPLSTTFHDALHLYMPFLVQRGEVQASSVMSGVLPGTSEWNELYGEPADLEFEWRKFKQRHVAARERALLSRRVLGNEALELRHGNVSKVISLQRPDIRFSGCVGHSMEGSDIRYMDLVATYPRKGAVAVDTVGEPDADASNEDADVYTNFRIHIGEGVELVRGSIVELRFLDHVMREALEGCPVDLREWAGQLRKIRHISSIKKKGDRAEDIDIGVSYNRDDKLEAGFDHPVDAIEGRVFTRYKRTNYESQIRYSGDWGNLSLSAQFPDLLGPKYNWNTEFSKLSKGEQGVLKSALLGNGELYREAVGILREHGLDSMGKVNLAQISQDREIA